jgi:hypothetical protein
MRAAFDGGVKPGHDPQNVGVDDVGALIEGDRGDGGGGIGADARKAAQGRLGARKTRPRWGHALGALQKIARPGVVTKTRPGSHDVGGIGFRERFDRRPSSHKGPVIGAGVRRGGLLEHDLREPDGVGIGPLATPGTPGKIAAIGVVPGQEIGADLGDGHRRAR